MVKSDRLSAMDAAFFYMDNELAVMQTSVVAILESDIPFDEFVNDIRAKVAHIPRFRQVAAFVPFNFAYPTWEFDPTLDISNHVFETTLESPGTAEQLQQLAAKIFDIRLNRNKPLWSMHLIHGLERDRCAVMLKLHHSLVDGIGARNVLAVLFDYQPNPEKRSDEIPPAPPLPGLMARLGRAVVDNLIGAAKNLGRAPFVAAFLLRALVSKRVWAGIQLVREYRSAPGVTFPYNTVLSGGFKFVWTDFSVEEMSAIRAACGGTINDVILTAMAGAGYRYAKLHNIDTQGKNFKLQVPVSIRRKDQAGEWGNIVAIMYALVPFGIDDPVKRLEAITAYTRKLKEHKIMKGFGFAIKSAQTLMTPPGMALGARTFSSSRFQKWVHRKPKQPIFNIQLTNVPLYDGELYFCGRHITALYPLLHLLPSVGMTCPAVTVGKRMYVTLTGDSVTAPDIDKMLEFLHESFAELRNAAGVPAAKDVAV